MTRTVQLSLEDILAINELFSEILIGTCLALDEPHLSITREQTNLDLHLAVRERFLKAAGVTCPLPAEVSDFLNRKSPADSESITNLFCRLKPKGVN